MIEVRGAAYQFGGSEAMRIATVRVFLDALREGIYMFGTGVWVHIMLAIWVKVSSKLGAQDA
jgi:hypothetical protein